MTAVDVSIECTYVSAGLFSSRQPSGVKVASGSWLAQTGFLFLYAQFSVGKTKLYLMGLSRCTESEASTLASAKPVARSFLEFLAGMESDVGTLTAL